jgi:hypothetical protein
VGFFFATLDLISVAVFDAELLLIEAYLFGSRPRGAAESKALIYAKLIISLSYL